MELNKDQLVKVIKNGDDNKNNVLILKTNGEFELIEGIARMVLENVEYVARCETFARGNRYVGKEASQDVKYIKDIIAWANVAWDEHKKSGQVKMSM